MTSRGGTLRRNDTIETSVEREEEEEEEDGRGGIAILPRALVKSCFFHRERVDFPLPLPLSIRKVRVRMHVAERGDDIVPYCCQPWPSRFPD